MKLPPAQKLIIPDPNCPEGMDQIRECMLAENWSDVTPTTIHTDFNEFYGKFTDIIWKCAKGAFQAKNKSTGFKRDFALDDVSTHLNKVITILTNIYLVIAYMYVNALLVTCL